MTLLAVNTIFTFSSLQNDMLSINIFILSIIQNFFKKNKGWWIYKVVTYKYNQTSMAWNFTALT
jgi:hypothetical protein